MLSAFVVLPPLAHRSLASLGLLVALAACGARSSLASPDDARAPMDTPATDVPATDVPATDVPATPRDVPAMPRDVPAPDSGCGAVFRNAATASDEDVFACGLRNELEGCWVFDGGLCPRCACDYYVKIEGRCDPVTGVCGPPLDGNGCVWEGSFAGAAPNGFAWNCEGPDRAVVACALRRLIATGNCVR